MTPERYPLHWPHGWRRTKRRKDAAYRVSFARARDELLRHLSLMNARDVVLSTNVPLRRDGLPYANVAEPADPGVAVYWTKGGQPQVMACDRWSKVKDNVRAVGLAIEALRQLERTGASEILERVADHYRALARKRHPDRGGSPEEMVELNRARDEALRELEG